MSSNLTIEQIKSVKSDINSLLKLTYNLEDQIKYIKTIINNKEDFLLNYCNHKKEIDRNSCGEHTEYYCSICGIYL